MQRMFPIKGAIFIKFKFFLGIPPVFFGRIVFPFTFAALQGHQFYRSFFGRHISLLKNTLKRRRRPLSGLTIPPYPG
jgi:hypothetical protein